MVGHLRKVRYSQDPAADDDRPTGPSSSGSSGKPGSSSGKPVAG